MGKLYSEIVNKYDKHQLLLAEKDIKEHLPETDWLSKETLKSMLKKYKVVYVKPSRGTGGRGIIKLEKKRLNHKWTYIFHYRKKKKHYTKFLEMYKHLKKKINKIIRKSKKDRGKYLVQQGIELLKYENSLFDVRSFVQFNPDTFKFECNGVLVRVGHPNKIVTNISNSGRAMDYHTVFQSTKKEVQLLKRPLEELSIKIATAVRNQCEEILEVGLDFGYDENLKPWLIEVNLKPRYKGFKKIDKVVYNKIHNRSKELKQLKKKIA